MPLFLTHSELFGTGEENNQKETRSKNENLETKQGERETLPKKIASKKLF